MSYKLVSPHKISNKIRRGKWNGYKNLILIELYYSISYTQININTQLQENKLEFFRCLLNIQNSLGEYLLFFSRQLHNNREAPLLQKVDACIFQGAKGVGIQRI